VLYWDFGSVLAKNRRTNSNQAKADTKIFLTPVSEVIEFVAEKKLTSSENNIARDIALQHKACEVLDELTPLLKYSPKKLQKKQSPELQNTNHEKYEYITEYGTQILCLLNVKEGCTYLSRNFEKLTGHFAPSQYGQAFFDIFHSDFSEKFRTFLPSCISASAAQNFRCKLQHADGKFYWYQLAVHNNNGEYVCVMENINENILVQSTLQKAKLEAELALRARSEFLANMSHELRTPLNAVIGFSQIMESGLLGKIENEHHAGYIKNIKESGHDLLAKIEDLLEIADIEAGRISLAREEVYINDLVKNAMQMQEHHAKEKNVALSYIPRGNMLLFVDRLKLQHIIGHLLSNAIKFNKSGGAVTIEVSRAENSALKISVHDNGEGMSDIKCHDIREALQQESCWTAKDSHHIGIGLALTKEIVNLHEGEVDIESSAGIGTTLSLTLPRQALRIVRAREMLQQDRQLANG
jgi:PAS domain S-box-containing protein